MSTTPLTIGAPITIDNPSGDGMDAFNLSGEAGALQQQINNLSQGLDAGATQPTAPTQSTSILDSTSNWFKNAATQLQSALQGGAQSAQNAVTSGASNAVGNAENVATTLAIISSPIRLSAAILGIIAVVGGVFMLKQTQIVVQGATRVGKKVAELAG